MKHDDKLPDDTIRLYDPEMVITHHENSCICGSGIPFSECVRCKAKNMSHKATAVLITENEHGDAISIREVWLH